MATELAESLLYGSSDQHSFGLVNYLTLGVLYSTEKIFSLPFSFILYYTLGRKNVVFFQSLESHKTTLLFPKENPSTLETI